MWAAIVAFFKNAGALIAVIRAIISLLNEFRAMRDAQRAAEQERLRQEREKAAQDLVNAGAEEEFDDAQDRLVRTKP